MRFGSSGEPAAKINWQHSRQFEKHTRLILFTDHIRFPRFLGFVLLQVRRLLVCVLGILVKIISNERAKNSPQSEKYLKGIEILGFACILLLFLFIISLENRV